MVHIVLQFPFLHLAVTQCQCLEIYDIIFNGHRVALFFTLHPEIIPNTKESFVNY